MRPSYKLSANTFWKCNYLLSSVDFGSVCSVLYGFISACFLKLNLKCQHLIKTLCSCFSGLSWPNLFPSSQMNELESRPPSARLQTFPCRCVPEQETARHLNIGSTPSDKKSKDEVRTQLGKRKCSILWVITPCGPLKVNGRFGGTYHSIFGFEE
jgi:hypothetical protein